MIRIVSRAACIGALSLLAGAALAAGLPSTSEEAAAIERADALPASALYGNPYDLKGTKPGDLLAQEAFDGYTVRGLGRARRIVYHSSDVAGHDVVTTAMVLLPAGSAPAGGWPVVAWAHGTSGEARECAPSLMRDAYYGELGLSDYLQAGIAVVATDYHGLGSDGTHLYISKISQARDVIYSVPAARRAEPALGRHWIAAGHSQGGLASWGVAELESQHDDADYLGAVSVSGGALVMGFLEYIDAHAHAAMYLPWIAAGIQARFPDFRPETLLTPAALKAAAQVTAHGCWYAAYAAYADLPPHAALQPGFRDNPYVKRWAAENDLGKIRTTKPLLVITGDADQTVPAEGVRATVQAACALKSNLAFHSLPGLDHTPAMTQSTPEQIAFMKARFAGQPFSAACPG